MDFDTARLRAFVQVAERGTVAAAADALGYTGPAVSQQLAKLEAQLGATLFDRAGGRLKVSPRGEQLLPIARRFLDLTGEIEQLDERPMLPRRVVIAGFASALEALVIPLLSSRAMQGIACVVQEAEDDDALRELRLGQVDVAIVQEYDGAPIARSDRLRYTPLASDRLRLLAPPTYGTGVRLHQLAELGWLVNGAGTKCEEATQRVLADAGITPNVVGHIADNETLLALVCAGHGATIAPELVVRRRRRKLTVARVDLHVRRSIIGVTRASASDAYRPLLAQMAAAAKATLNR